MKERATLTIKGSVQKVGFRTFVEKEARSKGIKGYASNLADKSVLVVCEGEQAEISGLIDAIKSSPFNIVDMQKSHGEATGEFATFKRMGEDVPQEDATLGDVIKVLKSFDSKAEDLVKMQRETKEELGEKLDHLGDKIDSVGEKTDALGVNLGAKIDSLGEKTDSLGVNLGAKIDSLGEKTESFHQDMSSHFELLDDKYGIIAEMIGKAVEGIEKTNRNMERNTGKILKETAENTEKILTRMEMQQEAHNQLIEKLIKAMINKSGK